MHSLKEGLSVLMYSRTHIVNLNGALSIHKGNAVRLQIPKNMAIIFHESLYYAEAKTRNTPQFQPDKYFHSYVWPTDNTKTRKRSSGSNDGIAREMGNKVYRTDISRYTCKHLYDKCNTNCDKCKSDEVVMKILVIFKS